MSRDGSGPPTPEEALALAARPGEEAVRLHRFYRGKVQTMPKCPVAGYDDFAIWYTPGVAAPCREIVAAPDLVWEHTNRGNTVAIVTDGTRVLGLGDIGPEAGLPVMEGKAPLFKVLGGVDAVPICLATRDAEEIVRTVELLSPSFGAINLEDISQPKCFHVLDSLRRALPIPVWHDDQQGTATALLAGLLNALEVVGKQLASARIVVVGAGAAGVSSYRLLVASGADPARVIVCDRRGTLHRGRRDLETQQERYAAKWQICSDTNPGRITGGIAEALQGADACVAFSSPGPGVIAPAWVATMAPAPIVFACANPVPEIWPWEARQAGAAVVATGRSDFPNQLNNSLVFPGLFRGILDVRARLITDGIATRVAHELAAFARARGIGPDDILPRMDEEGLHEHVAVAAALAAQDEGVATLARSRDEIAATARATIMSARRSLDVLMSSGSVPERPS